MNIKIKKVVRFIKIYGLKRTLVKVAGRTRNSIFKIFFIKPKKEAYVSLIGCGQFGFSTISFFLNNQIGNHFLECYDIDRKKALSTASFWTYTSVDDVLDLINNIKCRYIYIASDHFSHTDYAIKALTKGKVVYCEKPISVTYKQLKNLVNAMVNTKGKIYFGYNRPFSKSINEVVDKKINNTQAPISIGCFIYGHKLDDNHWYNDPKEGTRICGNMGHWIDLAIHLFNIRGKIPNVYKISLTFADDMIPDDNITVSFSTDMGDLVTIIFTTRSEPFEGINEQINLQFLNTMLKIDDFRKITIWERERKKDIVFFPKDVGHKKSVIQPFIKDHRDNKEVIISTLLMIKIKELAVSHESYAVYDLQKNAGEIMSML